MWFFTIGKVNGIHLSTKTNADKPMCVFRNILEIKIIVSRCRENLLRSSDHTFTNCDCAFS